MAQTLRFPLTVSPNGNLVPLTQDAAAELGQSVAMILATTLGERAALPDFGVPDFTGSLVDEDEIIAAIKDWEPRVDDADVVVTDLGATGQPGRVRIDVTITSPVLPTAITLSTTV